MKNILLLLMILILSSCSKVESIPKKIVLKADNNVLIENIKIREKTLDKEYFLLLDDEIVESDRNELEKKYKNFIDEVEKIKLIRNLKVDTILNNLKLKYNFLKDLKD